MKLIKIMAMMLCLFAFLPFNAEAKKLKDNEAQAWFSVDIHCPSCKQKIEAQLSYVTGVKDLKVDVDKKTIWIVYRKDKLDVKRLLAELDKIGYPGVEVSEEEALSETPAAPVNQVD